LILLIEGEYVNEGLVIEVILDELEYSRLLVAMIGSGIPTTEAEPATETQFYEDTEVSAGYGVESAYGMHT
jgi:hypothetical protein